MFNIYSPIKSLADVKAFTLYLYNEKQVAFHPDDPFEDYINMDDHERSFSSEEAQTLNSRIEECFDICHKENVDIYDFMMQFSPIHSLMN